MNFTEVTLSYPYVQHKVEISHFTARKSTAIEWVILEAINRCENLEEYAGIPISNFFEQIFTISDADLLIKPVLISLQDMGAIRISGIDDETELATVPMRNMQLTDTGREMQMQGLLPGVNSEETFSIYYDVAAEILRTEVTLCRENATGIPVIDVESEDDLDFPEGAIRQRLASIQKDTKRKSMSWLTPTTVIEEVNSLDSQLYWRNITRKVELVEGMQWKISGVEDTKIHEATLEKAEIANSENLPDLPRLEITDPDKEIYKLVSFDDIDSLVTEYMQKDDLFCVDAKYYKTVGSNNPNEKDMRLAIIYGADAFKIENKGKQMNVCVPDTELCNNGLYYNAKNSIQSGITSVNAGGVSRDIAIAYIPNANEVSLPNTIVGLVDKYYKQDNIILLALYKLGLKDMFLQYIENILAKEPGIADKEKVINAFNQEGKKYYGRNVISASDKEKLLVNEGYIFEKSKDISGAKTVVKEYASINSFRQDRSLFMRIFKLVIEQAGEQNSLESIWEFWQAVSDTKKAYLNEVNKSRLYKKLYSKKSILDLIRRFGDEDLFEIEEYTPVEKTILELRRITEQIASMLPELDLQKTVSQEKYAEIILAHKEEMDRVYDKIRQWQEEEERLDHEVIDLEEALGANPIFSNIKNSLDGLKNALATFFDDSFMKYKNVFIVDTCTLMNEPELISWFEGENTMLVIPMTVLDELDGLKESENQERAYQARDAIRSINNYRVYDWVNIKETSHPELLPKDLDKDKNDNKILSIALKYCVKNPVLLTDDINLANIAEANNVKNITLDSYQAMKKHEKLVNQGNSNKKKGKKKGNRKGNKQVNRKGRTA